MKNNPITFLIATAMACALAATATVIQIVRFAVEPSWWPAVLGLTNAVVTGLMWSTVLSAKKTVWHFIEFCAKHATNQALEHVSNCEGCRAKLLAHEPVDHDQLN